MAGPNLRGSARIRYGDECWKIAVLGAERVTHPGSGARKTVEHVARAHLILSRSVRVRLCGHRVDEAHLVDQLGEVRQKIARHLSRLAAGLKFPKRFDEVSLLALKSNQAVRSGHRRVMPFHQLRFVVERVDVADGS